MGRLAPLQRDGGFTDIRGDQVAGLTRNCKATECYVCEQLRLVHLVFNAIIRTRDESEFILISLKLKYFVSQFINNIILPTSSFIKVYILMMSQFGLKKRQISEMWRQRSVNRFIMLA